LLVVPSAWVAGPLKRQQFRTLATARAIENVCYVAAAVQSPPAYTGQSCVIEPFGEVIAELTDPDADGVAIAEVFAERVTACRAKMPSLDHRRWRVEPR